MNKDDFIKKYRTLIKKYHPDSIQDPVMKEKYEVISKNLNSKYAEYKASNSHVKVARKPAVSTLRLEEHNDYYYYKLGYEHYIKIHPSRWVKIDSISELMSGSYTSPNFEIQIQIIKETLSNFASSVENFQYIADNFPNSHWRYDSIEKIKFLRKLHGKYMKMLTLLNSEIQ